MKTDELFSEHSNVGETVKPPHHTHFGFPERWREESLGGLSGASSGTINPLDFPNELFEYYSIPAFQEQNAPILERGSAIFSIKLLVENGTVLFGKLNPRVLKVWLVDSESPNRRIASTEFLPIVSNGLAEPKFVYFMCHSDIVVSEARRLVSGSTPSRQRVDPSAFYEILIPLPPLDEQRTIARTLDAVRNTIEARRHELRLERERKAALMDYLFTHGALGEPTKQTEIGKMPESWKLTTLGELCNNGLGSIQTGPFGSQLHAADYVQSGIPVVNPTHLLFNGIETDRLPKINKELADALSRHYLFEGDILISRRGDFSRYAYIGSKEAGWLCGTGCLLVRLANPAVENYFLAISMSLEPIQNYLKDAAVGSIMPNLNTRILSRMPVIVPHIEEQRRIAEVVRSCEAKIRALEEEEPLRDELFNAMLEELMSGRLSAVPLLEEQSTK